MTLFSNLIQLFFPDLCIICGNKLYTSEKFICLECLADLPKTNFYNESGNIVEQLFWGRVQIESATSFFFFRKGSKYQKILHFLKYKGLKEVGFEIGINYGFELQKNSHYASVDFIVPVPLHPKKLKQRGYNQSEWIARGISKVLHKPVESKNLVRKVYTSTQTRKTRFERWQNVEDIFKVSDPEIFKGKHILLIDDVVTTGATLEACVVAVQKAQNTKISIATLAYAEN